MGTSERRWSGYPVIDSVKSGVLVKIAEIPMKCDQSHRLPSSRPSALGAGSGSQGVGADAVGMVAADAVEVSTAKPAYPNLHTPTCTPQSAYPHRITTPSLHNPPSHPVSSNLHPRWHSPCLHAPCLHAHRLHGEMQWLSLTAAFGDVPRIQLTRLMFGAPGSKRDIS